MKKWLSALLLVVLLIQTLPVDALAAAGKVLSKEEFQRAYALSGLGQGDGVYHNGMRANENMSGMQLAHWLEERLDTRLHNIDDVLSRIRCQLAGLEEKYPAIYRAFTDSPYYGQVEALTVQAEELRLEMSCQLERVRTDINMISQMGARLEEEEGARFDSERVRASARIEEAVAELTEIRAYVVENAEDWDARLRDWTKRVQSSAGDEAEDAVADSLRSLLGALWRKYNLGEESDGAVEAELRGLLKAQFVRYAPRGDQADAFADEAVALLRDMWAQYDPDGATGTAIIAEIQTLLRRLFEKYGQDGSEDAALAADLQALMRALWQKYGPESEANRAFTAAFRELLAKYGLDSAAVEELSAEINAMIDDMWNRYGPDGESRDELLALVRSLWGSIGTTDGEGGLGQWIASVFTAQSAPVTNSAPVVAVTASNSRLSRLSEAAGVRANDQDASVTVISKNQICISLVTGVRLQREAVPGVSVKVRDATTPDAPLTLYKTDEDGLVKLPANLFVADKYDVVHLYVEVDPRPQGFRDFIIEDLDLPLGTRFMDTLSPIEAPAAEAANAAGGPEFPYIVSASFNGKDIMHSEYEMIYSPANSKKFTIKVLVDLPANGHYPDLKMSWYENAGGFKSLQMHWADATSRTVLAGGRVEYTFKGEWKQKFSPNASDKQRPTFSFGKDDDALSYRSQLVALRSATDAPLNEGTGAEGGVYGSVLGTGFSMGFKIPVLDVGVGLNLPFTQY